MEKRYCRYCTFYRGSGAPQPCDESGACPTCTPGTANPAHCVPLRSIHKETNDKIAESVKTIMRYEKALMWYRDLLAKVVEQEKQDAEQND